MDDFMLTVETLTRRFEQVFERRQATVLADTFKEAYDGLVRQSDFAELKTIIKALAEAQQRTEMKVAALSDKVADLTDAQQRLTDAQQRTENSLARLIETVDGLGQELGGLSRGVSYSLENDAYRLLPAFLQERHGIELDKRIVRTTINDKEIDLFAHGQRNGEPILLVGESKLQLDERRRNYRAAYRIFDQLVEKTQAVQKNYPDTAIVQLLITHYARPAFLEEARRRGVIVVQSFEW